MKVLARSGAGQCVDRVDTNLTHNLDVILRLRAALAAASGLLVVALSGCGLQDYLLEQVDSIGESGIPSTIAVGPGGTYVDSAALTRMLQLPVRSRVSMQGYSRAAFGPLWDDNVDVQFGRNGCNTRDDILRRDLTQVELRRGTCLVQRGVLHDPYSGETIEFVRGPETSETVQVDHVVALADAWYKGARAWDDKRRRDFANDPRNLLAVGAKANFDKAFRDAAGWLPANAAFECDFVARQVEVKADYGLWVSSNEKTAMRRVLRNC